MKITVAKNGENLGPYTVEEINALVLSGKIRDNDWAWPEDASDWVPVGSLIGVGGAHCDVSPVEKHQDVSISTATPETANSETRAIPEQAAVERFLATENAQREELPQIEHAAAVRKIATRSSDEEAATETRKVESPLPEIQKQSEQEATIRPAWKHGNSFAHITDPARRQRAVAEERRYLQAIREDERRQERERRKLEKEMEAESRDQKNVRNSSLMASMCVYLSDDGASQPVKFAVVAGLIKSGVLPEDTEVCFVGTDRWVRASGL